MSCQRHRVRPTTLQGRARPPPVGGRRRESGEHNYYTKIQGGSGWAQARGLSTAAAVRVREADKRGVVACIRDAIAVADERMIMHMIAVSCIEWNMSLREQRILQTSFPGSCFPTSGKTPGANQRTTDSNLHLSVPSEKPPSFRVALLRHKTLWRSRGSNKLRLAGIAT